MKNIGLFLISLLVSFSAFGAGGGIKNGLLIGTSLFYYTHDWDTTSSSKDKVTYLYNDFKIGYVLPSGLYFGGIYGMNNINYGSATSDSEVKRTSLGGSIGYFADSGLFVMGHLYLSSTFEDPSYKLISGTGIQGDLGYMFSVASNVYLGLQLSYKNFSYSKYDTVPGTTEVSETNKHNELLPMFNLDFVF